MKSKINQCIAHALSILMILSTLTMSIGNFGVQISYADDSYVTWAKIDTSEKTITMHYDDYLDVSSTGTVGTISNQNPTSKQVKVTYSDTNGYTNSLDEKDVAVIENKSGTLHAIGVGTAKVAIGSDTYDVSVTAAPISVWFVLGQSNANGAYANPKQSIVCPDGMVYASDAGNTSMNNIQTNTKVPAALAGTNSTVDTVGGMTKLSNYPINALTKTGNVGRIGMDSGVAYEWINQHKSTGEKAWVINSGWDGVSITSYLSSGNAYKGTTELWKAVGSVMDAEVAAGHYDLEHMGYFWLQGESDSKKNAEWYTTQYKNMHAGLKSAVGTWDNIGNPIEMGGILLVRAAERLLGSGQYGYRTGAWAEDSWWDSAEKKYSGIGSAYGGTPDNDPFNIVGRNYRDLSMTGPRVAQYYMANSTDDAFKDVYLVCDVADEWVYGKGGTTNALTDYWNGHYKNGIDYKVFSGETLSVPTVPNDPHNVIHYNQIGFNEIGREAARNATKILNSAMVDASNVSVDFRTWNGNDSAADGDTVAVGTKVGTNTTAGTSSLLVPRVQPVYMTKQVSYSMDNNIKESYYDYTIDESKGEESGILKASLGDMKLASVTLAVSSDEGKPVTVELDAGTHGKVKTKSFNAIVGEIYGKNLVEPTNVDNNFEFVGWFTAERKGRIANSKSTVKADGTKLYAKYRRTDVKTYTFDFTNGNDLFSDEGDLNIVLKKWATVGGNENTPGTDGAALTDSEVSNLFVSENGSQCLDFSKLNKSGSYGAHGYFSNDVELPFTNDWTIEYTQKGMQANHVLLANDWNKYPKDEVGFWSSSNNKGENNLYVIRTKEWNTAHTGTRAWYTYGAKTAGGFDDWVTYKYVNTWDGTENHISLYKNGVLLIADLQKQTYANGNIPYDTETAVKESLTNYDFTLKSVFGAGYRAFNAANTLKMKDLKITIGTTHKHTYDENSWLYDQYTHYHLCDECGQTIGVEDHNMANDTCSVCGYTEQEEGTPQLSGLTTSDGSLDALFKPAVSSYNLYSESDSVTITPTAENGTTITIEGNTVATNTAYKINDVSMTPKKVEIVVSKDDKSTKYVFSVMKLAEAKDQSFGYDGEPHGLSVTTNAKGTKVQYGVSESAVSVDESPTVKKTGAKKTVYWKASFNTLSVTGSNTIEIVPSNEIKDLSVDSWTYGEAAKKPTSTASYGEVVYSYSDKEDGKYTAYDPEKEGSYPVNAGTYYLKASVEGTITYGSAEAVTEFEVKPLEAQLAWKTDNSEKASETLEYTYDGNAHVPYASVSNLQEGDEVSVTIKGEQTKVGNYVAKATALTGKAADNYKLSEVNYKPFKIVKINETSEPSSEVTPAEAATKAIASLPVADKLTLDDADSVAAAGKAYDALTDAEKKNVSAETLKKLTDAEAKIGALYKPIKDVEKMIDELPAPSAATYKDVDTVYAAMTAYDALTEAEKAKVGKAYEYKLEGVIAAMVKSGAAGTVNKSAVSAEDIDKAEALGATKITLGKKVRKVKARSLAESSAKTMIVKTKKLTKSRVKGFLKGSQIKTVSVKVGTNKVNKKYVKKYKTIFTKKNVGKKVTVK